MPGLFDIGKIPGTVSPGEYGNSALLTARGDIVYRDSTGLPVRLPLGADGLVLMSDGTDLKYRYPPGYLLQDDPGTTYANSLSETSILANPATASFPAFVAVGDRVDLYATGWWLTGATVATTFNLYAGSTKIYTVTSPTKSAGVHVAFLCDLKIRYLSSTTISIGGLFITRSSGAGVTAVGAIGDEFLSDGEAVTVTALPQTIDFKTVLGSTTATTSVKCTGFQARYYPKN